MKARLSVLVMGITLVALPAGSESSPEPVLLHQSDFTSEQRQAWQVSMESWQQTRFDACLRKLKFKMNCRDCGDIYLLAELVVDQSGALTGHRTLEAHIDCERRSTRQRAAMQSCLEKSAGTLAIPAEFRDIKLHVKLGRVTRC